MSELEIQLSFRAVKSRPTNAGAAIEVICVFEFTPSLDYYDLFMTEAAPLAWRSNRFSPKVFIPDLAKYEQWEEGFEFDVETPASTDGDVATQFLNVRNESGLSYKDVAVNGWLHNSETLIYLERFKVFSYRNVVVSNEGTAGLCRDLQQLSLGVNPTEQSDTDYLLTLLDALDFFTAS